MQVTFNPSQNINTANYNRNYSSNKFNQTTNFKGNPLGHAEDVVEVLAGDSRIFDPIKKKWAVFIKWGAKNIVGKLLDSSPVGWFAEKTRNNTQMVNHLNALGSAVTSGLYVKKTLDNNKMDKDRKRTLAINQAMVFGLSTAGSYLTDASLNKLWEGVTVQYAGLKLNQPDLKKNFLNYNKNIELANKTLEKGARQKTVKAMKYMTDIAKVDPLKLGTIDKQLKGMDVAKKLFIFSMIYRYIAPVLVTPVANKVGEKYLEYKKNKQAKQIELNPQNQHPANAA